MESKPQRFYRVTMVGLVAVMLTTLLAACSGEKTVDTKENKVLRIAMLYNGSESWFRQKYVDAYEYTHPNVTVELVAAATLNQYTASDSGFEMPEVVKSMKALMNGKNPADVVIMDTENMRLLIKNNMVKALDPLIQEDKFDTSDIVPSVMEGIKQMGNNGEIYALAPLFQPAALFYNKKIFQQAGVELPKDGMTYDEIFNLARRLSKGGGKDRISGINLTRFGGGAIYNMQQYIAPLGLRMYDDKAEKMTVNTPRWEKVWENISKLYKDKIVYEMTDVQDGMAFDTQEMGFMSGKVAMEVADSGLIRELNSKNEAAKASKKLTPIEWGVVTTPVHPDRPGVGNKIYLSEAMAINSNAPDAAAAWDFIKSVNGPEWAKVKGRTLGYEMVTRKSFLNPGEDQTYNVEAFYKHKPAPYGSLAEEEIISKKPALRIAIYQVATPIFQDIIDGNKTVKEGITEWEKKGNEILKYLEKDPKANFQPDGTPIPSKKTAGSTT